jgi:hypothetical protein
MVKWAKWSGSKSCIRTCITLGPAPWVDARSVPNRLDYVTRPAVLIYALITGVFQPLGEIGHAAWTDACRVHTLT